MTPADLRRLRNGLGLSQGAFARLVGVATNTVARWERGELGMRTTTRRLLEMIAAQPPKKSQLKKRGNHRGKDH